jgi:HlyD family secretion protein
MSSENHDLSSLRIDHSKRAKVSINPWRKKTYLWILLVVFIFILLFVFSGTFNAIFSKSYEVSLTTVSLQRPGQTNAILTASGYIVAQRKAAVASKGTGRLVYLGVVEGDKVTKNQVIARLEDNDIQAQLAKAKASLKIQEADLVDANANYDRQQKLLNDDLGSREDYLAAEASYLRVQASIELAKAGVQEAEVALENTLIRAPFDGTVLTKNADIGEIVAPLAAGVNSRAAVVTIADMTSLQVEADVSESNIEKIEVGLSCEITLDAYPNNPYAGSVVKIVPTADRSKATVMVKVAFKDYDQRVLPEMSAKVLFLKNNGQQTETVASILAIPEGALVQREGKSIVYRVKDDRAVETAVVTGKDFDGFIEIVQGLVENEKIINDLNDNILDGVKVTIK